MACNKLATVLGIGFVAALAATIALAVLYSDELSKNANTEPDYGNPDDPKDVSKYNLIL